MLIREEVNRDQIQILRKIDLKNHEDIVLSSELLELDLDEFKLLFNKPAWREVEDLFEKIEVFLFVIFVVKIVIQIINISFV